MLFNSLEFALFLPIVFLLYWFVLQRNLKLQNLFIVGVSYLFYGWWDWRFLILIAFTSLCSYVSGLLIERFRGCKLPPSNNYYAKVAVVTNVVLNLAILGIFKYFDFFQSNFQELFRLFGVELDSVTLRFILPVGISFYTFQALSYSIDVYRGKIAATRDVVAFFAYVSFFPQLVAGPIERATNLLPQFYTSRTFDYQRAIDGFRQILWGVFKKVVIADNCAVYVNETWADIPDSSGGTLALAAVLFAVQIYGDFSGYSDIAIGVAKLFGINLMQNFNYPYLSRDIAEFWRRWHISLSTWFRDYLYIPLGGSRGGKWMSLRNTLIIFAVSGFWHGANWTFVLWGIYHGLLFAPLLLAGKNRKFVTDVVAENSVLPTFKELGQMFVTFILVVVGWIIFRAESMGQAFEYMNGILDPSILESPKFIVNLRRLAYYMPILIIFEWLCRHRSFGLDLRGVNPWLRRVIYIALIFFVFLTVSYSGMSETFIYFQF